jgi:hypothetical protein
MAVRKEMVRPRNAEAVAEPRRRRPARLAVRNVIRCNKAVSDRQKTRAQLAAPSPQDPRTIRRHSVSLKYFRSTSPLVPSTKASGKSCGNSRKILENLGKSWKITEPRRPEHKMESLATAGPTFSLADAVSAAVSCFGIDADAVRDPAPPK